MKASRNIKTKAVECNLCIKRTGIQYVLLNTYLTSGLNIAKRIRYRPAPTPPAPMITNRGINWNNNTKKIKYHPMI